MLLPEDLIKLLSFGEIDSPEYFKSVEILNDKLKRLNTPDFGDSKTL